jgi:phosphatidylglycerophosphatase A
LFFSSAFGVGYIKYAPGTFGTFVGVLIWALFASNACVFQIILLFAIFIISVFFSSLAEKIYNKKDDQRIVIDEVAGVWFSVAFLPKTFLFLFLGMVLFRLLDAKKPFFISNTQKIKSGLGVTIDDVIAGIIVNIVLHFVKFALYNNKSF